MIIRSGGISILLGASALIMGCAALPVWEGWDIEERGRYFGLSWVAPESVAVAYRSHLDRRDRDSCYLRYWSLLDSSGRALEEHRRRLDEARSLFGDSLFYWDERSRWWVKYGKPEVRLCYHAQPHALEGHRLVGAKIIKEQPWEIWEYHRLGLAVDFIKKGEYFQLAWQQTLDSRHPVAYFAVDSGAGDGVRDSMGYKILPLEYSHGRFRADSPNMIRWEIYWWLPEVEVGDGPLLLKVEIQRGETLMIVESVPLKVMGRIGNLPEPYIFGKRNFVLSPGRYRARLSLMDTARKVCYRSEISSELLDYRPGI